MKLVWDEERVESRSNQIKFEIWEDLAMRGVKNAPHALLAMCCLLIRVVGRGPRGATPCKGVGSGIDSLPLP
jgi:hypothetical protein